MNPATVHARALVTALARSGVKHACIAPGSRSAPIALALSDNRSIQLHVGIDERAVAFMALGIGKVTGEPAAVLTTSGSAAANLHPAVVEADLAEVPLILMTADRPPELQGVKAPQTMDQSHLYGSAVRWFHDPGVPDGSDPVGGRWAWLGSRAYQMSTAHPGPVHLNLPFREPLHPDGDEPNDFTTGMDPAGSRVHLAHTEAQVQTLASLAEHERGLIVVGTSRLDPASIRAFASATGWPLIAEAASRARLPGCITMYDLLLREPGFASEPPDFVLRLGDPGISKALLAYLGPTIRQVAVTASPVVADPTRAVGSHIRCSPAPLLEAVAKVLSPRGPTQWAERWAEAERRARDAVDRILDATNSPSEPRTARDLYDLLPYGARLLAASSMPIRELDWFMRAREDVDVLANRGVNGIDGFTSTLAGVTASVGEAFGLCGDLAFLHDLSGAAMAANMSLSLRMIVVNNDGGGIFSFLPYADSASFEELFGTPHGHDLRAIAGSLGFAVSSLEDPGSLDRHLDAMRKVPGPALLEVRTDRRANVELHRALWDAGMRAVRGASG